MMPSAKTTKANSPAMGCSAFAASEEVWMSVTPCACRVAAVVSMMKSATMLDAPMPTIVSSLMRASCRGAWPGRIEKGLGRRILLLVLDLLRACQKKR